MTLGTEDRVGHGRACTEDHAGDFERLQRNAAAEGQMAEAGRGIATLHYLLTSSDAAARCPCISYPSLDERHIWRAGTRRPRMVRRRRSGRLCAGGVNRIESREGGVQGLQVLTMRQSAALNTAQTSRCGSQLLRCPHVRM